MGEPLSYTNLCLELNPTVGKQSVQNTSPLRTSSVLRTNLPSLPNLHPKLPALSKSGLLDKGKDFVLAVTTGKRRPRGRLSLQEGKACARTRFGRLSTFLYLTHNSSSKSSGSRAELTPKWHIIIRSFRLRSTVDRNKKIISAMFVFKISDPKDKKIESNETRGLASEREAGA